MQVQTRCSLFVFLSPHSQLRDFSPTPSLLMSAPPATIPVPAATSAPLLTPNLPHSRCCLHRSLLHNSLLLPSFRLSVGGSRLRRGRIACEVAAMSSAPFTAENDEEASAAARIGGRVRVKGPLKVFHVPKVPEVDLGGMEGVVKQYVVDWKGKRISANLPIKVEFVLSGVEGRKGPLKFFAHLREDEFEYLD